MQLSCQQQPQEYCDGIPSHGSETFLQDQMQGDLPMETSDHNLDAQQKFSTHQEMPSQELDKDQESLCSPDAVL